MFHSWLHPSILSRRRRRRTFYCRSIYGAAWRLLWMMAVNRPIGDDKDLLSYYCDLQKRSDWSMRLRRYQTRDESRLNPMPTCYSASKHLGQVWELHALQSINNIICPHCPSSSEPQVLIINYMVTVYSCKVGSRYLCRRKACPGQCTVHETAMGWKAQSFETV